MFQIVRTQGVGPSYIVESSAETFFGTIQGLCHIILAYFSPLECFSYIEVPIDIIYDTIYCIF